MNAEYKIGLAPVNDDAATGIAKEILDGTKAKLGFVPNMYRAMANSGGYLSTYVHGYNAFRQQSGFTPVAYSGVIRPPIPIVSGHPYRFNPAGDSGVSGHPVFA